LNRKKNEINLSKKTILILPRYGRDLKKKLIPFYIHLKHGGQIMQCLGTCQLCFVFTTSVHKRKQIFAGELHIIVYDIIQSMITCD